MCPVVAGPWHRDLDTWTRQQSTLNSFVAVLSSSIHKQMCRTWWDSLGDNEILFFLRQACQEGGKSFTDAGTTDQE